MYIYTIVKCHLLQSSVSHDSSEIFLICGFDAQETFLIIINVENRFYILISGIFDEIQNIHLK